VKSVRVPLTGLAEGERTLDPASSRYLCRVLRLPNGASFVAFDPEARIEADGRITFADPEAARVTLGDPRAARVVAERPLVLVYALAKGDKVDATVRDATELGATKVVICATARSVVRKTDRPKTDRWRRVAEQAARQCGRADVPVIEGVLPWCQALKHAEECSLRFCLDPRARTGIRLVTGASYAFAIGPEGGLTESEIAEAETLGFTAASLGAFVLRTETVAAAVLGAVRVHDASKVE
jgi:16S rRNA (uracil1498-N3)-methyltransferase